MQKATHIRKFKTVPVFFIAAFCLLFIQIFIIQCTPEKSKYKGYSLSPDGINYRIISLGDAGKKIKPGDYITVDITYRTLKDSIFFTGRRKFKTTSPDYKGSIDMCFEMLNVNDSASFIIGAWDFFDKTIKAPYPSFFKRGDDFKVDVKLLNIQSKIEFEKERAEFMGWISGLQDYEQVKLKHFVENRDKKIQPSKSGLYCIKTAETQGAEVERGDTLIVDWEGTFLNGKMFDSTKKRKMPFEFVYGKEWQVVKGLEEGLKLMREGETAMLVMPSQLAFGQMGSSSGIIPPFTTVIFKVELHKVKKHYKKVKLL